MKIPKAVLSYFKEKGSEGGKKSSKNMTAAQRKVRAKKASDAAAAGRKAKQKPDATKTAAQKQKA
jgi:hypothetical protein